MKGAPEIGFIGIGAPKCGSTWLFYALGQHPKICLSEPKEVNYFNREDFGKPYVRGRDELPFINPNHTKDLAWYARHYKHCPADSLMGEFSPHYIFDEEATVRIHRQYPDVKLLACIRNPIDQLHSSYWARSRYSEKDSYESFEEAIEKDPRYLRRGYFAKNLKRYLMYFERRQLKVILLEDIISRPEQTIRDTFEFLEVESGVDLDLDRIPKNKAKKSRFVTPEPLLRRFAGFLIKHNQAVLLNKIRALGLKKMLLSISTVDHPRAPVSPHTRERLGRLFDEDISELEILLDRDLASWRCGPPSA